MNYMKNKRNFISLRKLKKKTVVLRATVVFCVMIVLLSGISAGMGSLEIKNDNSLKVNEDSKGNVSNDKTDKEIILQVDTSQEARDIRSSLYQPDITQNKGDDYVGNTGYEPWYYYVGGAVCAANGNLLFSSRDILVRAKGFNLEIIRSYNSHNSEYQTGFGYGWTHNYNVYVVEEQDDSVILVEGDGSSHNFTSLGDGNYASPPGIHSRLRKNQDNTFSMWLKDASKYSFDSTGALKNVTDRNGNKLVFGYTGERLETISDDSGLTINVNYNIAGRIESVTDPLGRMISYQYDAGGNLTNVTDAMGNSTLFFYYDPSSCTEGHHLVGVVDRIGRMLTFEHVLEDNNLVRATGIGNSLYNYTLETYPIPITVYVIDYSEDAVYYGKRGEQYQVQLNSQGNPTFVTDPLGGVIRYTWDAAMNLLRFVDENGNTYRYEYDAYGNMEKAIDPLGYQTTYEWNIISNETQYISLCTQATNARGFETTYEYDQEYNLNKTTNPVGDTIEYIYDPYGFMTGIKDFRGNWTYYNYTAHWQLKNETDALGNVTEYEYDDVGRLTRITDANGHFSTNVYNNNDYRIKRINELGQEKRFIRDAENFIISLIDEVGNSRNYTFNYIYEPDEIKDPSGNITSYKYDKYGNVQKITNARGYSQSKTYDILGRSTSTSDAQGRTITYSYDAVGNLISETDKKGRTTSYSYDTLNRLIKITNSDGTTINYTYDPVGNMISMTDEKGRTVIDSYDELNRLVSSTDRAGNISYYYYDENNNMIGREDQNSNTITYEYNPLNRVVTVTNPLDYSTMYQYDRVGNILHITDPNGHSSTYGYDEKNRIINVTDASDNLTEFEYDPLNNVISVTDAKSHTTTYDYDAMGRAISTTAALGNVTHCTYDEVGNIVESTDANGQTTHYEYDSLNRVTQITKPNGLSIEYRYDENGNLIQTLDNEEAINISYTYDDRDRVRSVTTDYGTVFSKTITYDYDTMGNLIQMIDPEGGLTNYTYDDMDRLTTITEPSGNVTRFEYDAGGRLTRTEYPNGVYKIYTYDNANRLINLTNYHADGTILSTYEYTYDNTKNKLSLTELDGIITSYTYDPLNRLVRSTDHLGNYIGYSYDPVGNRLTLDNNGAVITSTYDDEDHLISSSDGISYTYDNNGNVLTKTAGLAVTSYAYDFMDRLTTVTHPSDTIEYRYAPQGERLRRYTSSGDDTYYVHSYNNLIREYDSLGNVQTKYTHQLGIDSPVTMKRNNQVYYYLFDGLGSVTSLIDGSENTQASYTYDAFGEIIGETGSVVNPFTFTSRERDVDTDLYYYRTRYYNPEIGRFTSKDIVLSIAYAKDNLEFAGLGKNTYSYVDNNPVNYVDPMGLWKIGANLQGHEHFNAFQNALNRARNLGRDPKVNTGAYYKTFPKEMLGNGAGFWVDCKGPTLEIKNLPLRCDLDSEYGEFQPGAHSNTVYIASWLLDALCNPKLSDKEKQGILHIITVTIMHETAHWVDDQDGVDYTGPGDPEEGLEIETKIWGSEQWLDPKILEKLKCNNPPPPGPSPTPVPGPVPTGGPVITPTSPPPTPQSGPNGGTSRTPTPSPTPNPNPPRRPGGPMTGTTTPSVAGGNPKWGPVPTYPGSECVYFPSINDTSLGDPVNIHDGDFLGLGSYHHTIAVRNVGDYPVVTEVDFTLERWEEGFTPIAAEDFETLWIPDSDGDFAPPGWEVHHRGLKDTWTHEYGGHTGSFSAGITPAPPPPYLFEEWLVTDGYDFSGVTLPSLSFWYYASSAIGFINSEFQIWATTNGGTTPGDFMTTGIMLYGFNPNPMMIWMPEIVDLSLIEGEENIHIAFLLTGEEFSSFELYIDTILIEGSVSEWSEIATSSDGPYEIDPAAWIPSFFDVVYDTEGEYRATFTLDTPTRGSRGWSDDNPDNDVYQATFTVINDITPPYITGIFATPAIQDYGHNVNITCTVTDDTGVDTVCAIISSSDGTMINETMTRVGTTDDYYCERTYTYWELGNYIINIWAKDVVGNTNTATGPGFTIRDLIRPTTRVLIGEPYYVEEDGSVWVTSETLFTLSASDESIPGSAGYTGVNRTYYSIDGGPFIEYIEPFDLSIYDPFPSPHSITYYSVDYSNNYEYPKEFPQPPADIRIDNTPPQLVDGSAQEGEENLFGFTVDWDEDTGRLINQFAAPGGFVKLGSNDEHPRKVVDYEGNVHFVWMSKPTLGGNWEIYYKQLDPDGTIPNTGQLGMPTSKILVNDTMISDDNSADSMYPSLAWEDHEEVFLNDTMYSDKYALIAAPVRYYIDQEQRLNNSRATVTPANDPNILWQQFRPRKINAKRCGDTEYWFDIHIVKNLSISYTKPLNLSIYPDDGTGQAPKFNALLFTQSWPANTILNGSQWLAFYGRWSSVLVPNQLYYIVVESDDPYEWCYKDSNVYLRGRSSLGVSDDFTFIDRYEWPDIRFKHELSMMREYLVDQGYTDDNIYALSVPYWIDDLRWRIPDNFAGYTDPQNNYYEWQPVIYDFINESDWLDQDATHDNLGWAFTQLQTYATDDDIVFIELVDHGGGWNESLGGYNNSERPVGTDPRIKNDELQDGRDESFCTYVDPAEDWTKSSYWYDDEIDVELDKIEYKHMVIVVETCHSGGFIPDLVGPQRIVVASGREDEITYLYTYSFFQRINMSRSPNADTNGDNKVSVREAHFYAVQQIPLEPLSANQNPQIDIWDNIHVVWADQRDGNAEIYFSKLGSVVNYSAADNGVDLTTPDIAISEKDGSNSGRIVTDTVDGTFIEHPDIALDSNNKVHIVWSDHRNGNWQIYYQKQDDQNPPTVDIDDTRISGDNTDESQCPALYVDSNDNVHIAWQQDNSVNGTWEIMYQKQDDNGNVNINDKMATTNDGFDSTMPDIAVDTDGFVHIAFMDKRQTDPGHQGTHIPGHWEVYTLALDTSGTRRYVKRQSDMVNASRWWGEYTGPPTGPDGFSMYPKIETSGSWFNGDTYLTWHDNRTGNWEIYYSEIANWCNNPSTDNRITNNDYDDRYPDIALDRYNNPDMEWQGKPGSWDIFGTMWNGNTFIEVEIDGFIHDMFEGGFGGGFKQGSVAYMYGTPLLPGTHTYTFHTSNGLLNTSTQVFVTPAVEATTVWVDDNYNENTPGWQLVSFKMIQDGIDAVADYGTVHVNSGSYHERNIVIDKPLNLIGENKDTTFIGPSLNYNPGKPPGGFGPSTGLTDPGYNPYDTKAVQIQKTHDVTISGFTLRKEETGIYIISSNDISITENNICNNSWGVTVVGHSTNVNISHNIIYNNEGRWRLWSNNANDVDVVSVYHPTTPGLTPYLPPGVPYGAGIKLVSADNSNIVYNNIINNHRGITSSVWSIDNIIHYNNFISNTQNAYDAGSNTWDDNIDEGNYWDDFEENPGHPNTYDIPGGDNQDRYPLANPV